MEPAEMSDDDSRSLEYGDEFEGAYFTEEEGLRPLGMFSDPSEEPVTTLHWFRFDSLRLNDNPAFHFAVSSGQRLRVVVILDAWFNSRNRNGPVANVWRFLLESLHDLDNRLQKEPYQIRLNVFLGQPTYVLPKLFKNWNVTKLTFQKSQASFESISHDQIIEAIAEEHEVTTKTFYNHTLYHPEEVLKAGDGKYPQSHKEFSQLVLTMGRPKEPLPEPDPVSDSAPSSPDHPEPPIGTIPTLQEVGFDESEELYTNVWVGGETEALERLHGFCSKRMQLIDDPHSLIMSNDALSPYIRFGCLSVKQFFHHVRQHASTSGEGQSLFETIVKRLLKREFAFHVGSVFPGFDTMKQNPYCIKLPWDENDDYLEAWRSGKTGFPWIDAVIRQCRTEGFSHFFARESIAVFLTRGYLWVNWERGNEFFQEFMLDYELPVATVCWLQGSCSAYWQDKVELYDPVQIGKMMDPDGHYIKSFVPEVRSLPVEYVHSPWDAPVDVQKSVGCLVGQDYPEPIVELCDQGPLCCRRIQTMVSALQDVFSDKTHPIEEERVQPDPPGVDVPSPE